MKGEIITMRMILLEICFLSCASFNVAAQLGDCPPVFSEKQFLHIAHTRTGANPLMDQLVEEIDFSVYDMLWLGGDLALSTSANDTTMMHVDSVFNLGDETTLWALGNHDYADLERVRNFTQRKPYYASHHSNITFMVLDTQDSLSNIIGDQLDLFRRVTDTIQESSHLVLLHHKLFWMYGDSYLQSLISSVTNGGFGDCFYCINPNNFYTDLYPALLDVEERGIEVICIAGDIGFRRSEFEYTSPEGIQFLASGIEAGKTNNKALMFRYDSIQGTLKWEYLPLTQLLHPIDISPPVLHSLSLASDSILRGSSVQIIIEAEDSESGLSEFWFDIVNPFGEQVIAVSSPVEDASLLNDGKYAIEVTIPDTAVVGIWHISSIVITDSSENEYCKQYPDDSQTSFVVYTSTVHVQTERSHVRIYPNPGTGIFHIDPGLVSLQVFDQMGRRRDVFYSTESNTLDLSGQPKGMYFIRMKKHNDLFVLDKIIIH